MADTTTLPCGCRLTTDVIDGENTLIYEPCALDCRFYRYTLDESAKQGKPATIIDAR